MGKKTKGFFLPTISEKFFNCFNVIIMVCIGFITFYPFWFCLVLSLNEGADAVRGGPIFLWPRVFTLDNYSFIATNPKVLGAAFVSVSRTILGVLLHLALTGIVSYGLSKKYVIGRKIYLTIFILTMYFSGGLIPYYLTLRNLGLLDNFLIYIVPTMFSFYNCILMMVYYESIPVELEEAATIDGAGYLKVFAAIIIPTSLPIYATIALFAGVGQWNAWFDTLIYTKSTNLVTLQVIVRNLINQAEAVREMNEQMAAAGATAAEGLANISPITIRVSTMVFTILPISFVYPFLQRFFVKGILLGSVKG